jgi:hypothetical protein
MTLFAAALALHVLAAVLGVGPVAVMAIISSRSPSSAEITGERRALLISLSRWVSLALGFALLSGVLVEAGAGGSFHDTWWFRASFLLLVAVGILNAFARRRLKAIEASDVPRRMRAVARLSWAMCAIVAAITLLMTIRPL